MKKIIYSTKVRIKKALTTTPTSFSYETEEIKDNKISYIHLTLCSKLQLKIGSIIHVTLEQEDETQI